MSLYRTVGRTTSSIVYASCSSVKVIPNSSLDLCAQRGALLSEVGRQAGNKINGFEIKIPRMPQSFTRKFREKTNVSISAAAAEELSADRQEERRDELLDIFHILFLVLP